MYSEELAKSVDKLEITDDKENRYVSCSSSGAVKTPTRAHPYSKPIMAAPFSSYQTVHKVAPKVHYSTATNNDCEMMDEEPIQYSTVSLSPPSSGSVLSGAPMIGQHYTSIAPPPQATVIPPSPTAQDDSDRNAEQMAKQEISGVLPSGYTLSHCLAEGAMGRVYLVFNAATKDMLAAKVVSTRDSPKIRAETKREADLQRRLTHQHVCAVYGYRNTPRFCVIFMELVGGGELFDRIPIGSGLQTQEAFVYYAQILDALNYLHKNGVAHLDVKPENIMLTKRDRAKLIDFGWATDIRNRRPVNGQSGTVTYAAPEVFGNQPYFGPPADLFSLAITLMTMVTGERCWNRAVYTDSAYRSWQRKDYQLSPFDRLPPDLLAFLVKSLDHQPQKRLDYRAVVEHSWFRRALKGRATPLAPPKTPGGDAGFNSSSFSQPSEVSIGSDFNEHLMVCNMPLSQPCNPDQMLLPGSDCSQTQQQEVRSHVTSVMRRMTRFFSKLTPPATLDLLTSLMDQQKLLRYTVKGPSNIQVDIRQIDQPTTFRILLYPLAGGLLVDFRRVSGDGLLFRQSFLSLRAGMRRLSAVDDAHPYLQLVLPSKGGGGATGGGDVPAEEMEREGAASSSSQARRMQSVT